MPYLYWQCQHEAMPPPLDGLVTLEGVRHDRNLARCREYTALVLCGGGCCAVARRAQPLGMGIPARHVVRSSRHRFGAGDRQSCRRRGSGRGDSSVCDELRGRRRHRLEIGATPRCGRTRKRHRPRPWQRRAVVGGHRRRRSSLQHWLYLQHLAGIADRSGVSARHSAPQARFWLASSGAGSFASPRFIGVRLPGICTWAARHSETRQWPGQALP